MYEEIYSFTFNPPNDAINDLRNIFKEENNILGITHPDLHNGYSLPIGSTIASLNNISPEAIGFDINCGVIVIDLKLNMEEIIFEKYRKPLINLIKSNIKTGIFNNNNESNMKIFGIQPKGDFSEINLSKFDYFSGFEKNIKFNSDIPIENILNFGLKDFKNSFQYNDMFYNNNGIEYFEFNGSVNGNSKLISQKSKSKGLNCLNSIGSGNHYIEIVHVKELINNDLINILPFKENSILGLIHTGSRGLGHQVCIDSINKYNKYIKYNQYNKIVNHSTINTFRNIFNKKFNEVFLKESLKFKNIKSNSTFISEKNNPVFLPLRNNKSKDNNCGINHLYASNSAMNYAYVNRFLLANDIIRIFEAVFKIKGKIFCDSSHNMASIEKYDTYLKILKGEISNNEIHKNLNMDNSCNFNEDVLVIHRKGSTNVLPPSFFNPNNLKYQYGMPYIIGGSCFTNSYMMFSTNTHLVKLCSDAHGSGRVIKRSDCNKKGWNIKELNNILEKNGTTLIGTEKEMLTENGFCYRDVNDVIKYLFNTEPINNLKAVKLKPLMVIKG